MLLDRLLCGTLVLLEQLVVALETVSASVSLVETSQRSSRSGELLEGCNTQKPALISSLPGKVQVEHNSADWGGSPLKPKPSGLGAVTAGIWEPLAKV